MAVTATIEKKKAIIAVDNGTSTTGKALTKSYSYTIDTAATAANVNAFCTAIADVMAATAVGLYMQDKSLLSDDSE